ncbi:hypothetical protein C3943_25085 [Lysinibacillus sp. B2A1]|nr:hypothetical protein C3943_25085 [Lysinibacillus sp. B2A1]
MSRIFKGMNCAGTIQNPDALFICAKAKRQQQMFSVAKAKRQLQLRQGEIDKSSNRKRCGS